MGTSIRVSDETKRKPDRIKRDDETFNELLDRLADLEDTMQSSAGSWDGTDKAENALQERERMKGSFRTR
jgi:hypothetical protein